MINTPVVLETDNRIIYNYSKALVDPHGKALVDADLLGIADHRWPSVIPNRSSSTKAFA